MQRKLSLNGPWELAYSAEQPGQLHGERLQHRSQFCALVPEPVHQTLLRAGVLDDPNIGLNSLKARWVEEMVWVYRRTFTAPEVSAATKVWIACEKLEMDCEVYLNGVKVGTHNTAHRPAAIDVTNALRSGENLLILQLDAGLFNTADKSGKDYNFTIGDLLTKRHWQRKPQYQCGWDWNPRMMNVGILGDISLHWSDAPRLQQVTVFAISAHDLKSATFEVRATVEGIADVDTATLTARLLETGQQVSLEINVPKGESRHTVQFELDNPTLWWPRGHGDQHMYNVEVSLTTANGEEEMATRRTGVRLVEVDESKHPVTGEFFIVNINHRPIFCKGGNWVPADLLYSTVTPERYRELIQLAVDANFNTMRIWGGGLFADHALCDACDEAGLLIWHDLLFACSKYPADIPEFAEEVRREVRFGMRELAHHPSLVIWCGNNEIEWADAAWGWDAKGRTHPHYYIFHHDFPLIAHQEDPSKFYWLSSPNSHGFLPPNDPTSGDQHPWLVSFEDGPVDWWKYRTCVDRFPNEGGVLGCSSPATLRQFLPENERRLFSPSWEHHDNTTSYPRADPDGEGRLYTTMKFWLGIDPASLAWEDYAFASALLQSEGLQEYVSNYHRRKFSSAAAIFWMFNDSWPVTHGWTIVDYYLRKKLCFHPVRRAFADITVVVAEDDGIVTVYGVNDTMEAWTGEVRYGVFNLMGGYALDQTAPATLAANASTVLATFPRAVWEAAGLTTSGTFATLIKEDQSVAQHRLFLERFKDLRFDAKPNIELTLTDGLLTLTSNTFAWGVSLDVDGERNLADNCFDLFPDQPYTLRWDKALGAPEVLRMGNWIS